MQPEKGSPYINIPVTFDGGSSGRVKRAGVKLWLFIVTVVWILSSITGLVVADSIIGYLSPLWLLLFFSYIARFIILKEKFYRAKRRELMVSDFIFEHTVFWNIYDISNRSPYFVTFETGTKGLFVAFDKGVVIGKGLDSSFYHHEALMEAYQQVMNRNIEMIHIDYMDVVGKDARMDSLFELAKKSENPDIRKVLMRIFDHMEFLMNTSYASYDTYAFYYNGREDQFWSEMEQCLNFFLRANYLRYRILDKNQITLLVESTMNVDGFSVTRTNDAIFRKINIGVSYLRPIWVEKNGEREILNKTLEEIKEAKRIAQAEKKVKKRGNFFTRRKRSDGESAEVDLFSIGAEQSNLGISLDKTDDNENSEMAISKRGIGSKSSKTPKVPKNGRQTKRTNNDEEKEFDLFD